MIALDLNLLPRIVRHRIFMGIPPRIEGRLDGLRLPETVDRLRGASLFLDQMSSDHEPWRNRALLRAGLSEFRSANQALHWDLGTRDVYGPLSSRNPLIHLVARLRRIAVYVANAPTISKEVTATLTLGDKSLTTEIQILLIADLAAYLKREKFKSYAPAELSALCTWFEENQAEYGAPLVLSVGVYQYCEELIDVYGWRLEAPKPLDVGNAG